MEWQWGIGLWGLLAIAVGILAARGFGRSGIGWFLLASLLSPLVGLLLFVLPAKSRPCPFCAEPIKPAAVVCRYCNREVAPAEPANLPMATRLLLVVLVLGVMAASLSRCELRNVWWDRSPLGEGQPV